MVNNRARELVSRALALISKGGQWQTIATLLELTLGEIAELEERCEVVASPLAVAVLVEHPTRRALAGGRGRELVATE